MFGTLVTEHIRFPPTRLTLSSRRGGSQAEAALADIQATDFGTPQPRRRLYSCFYGFGGAPSAAEERLFDALLEAMRLPSLPLAEVSLPIEAVRMRSGNLGARSSGLEPPSLE